MSCFDGFHDKNHQYEVKLYGCKYTLWEEYDIVRDEIQPGECMYIRYNYKSILNGHA